MRPLEPDPAPAVRAPDPAPMVPAGVAPVLGAMFSELAAGHTLEAREAAALIVAAVDDMAAALVDLFRRELADALADTALVGDLTSRPDRAAMLEAIGAALTRHSDAWHRTTRGISP